MIFIFIYKLVEIFGLESIKTIKTRTTRTNNVRFALKKILDL